MKKRNEQHVDMFRTPKAERHYRNKQRELEKKQRRQPVGRRDWTEE